MFPRGSDAQGATSAAGKGQVKDSDALFGTGAGRLARMEVGKGSKPKKGTAKKGSDVDAIEMSLNARVGLGMVKTSSSKAMKIDRVAPTKFQIGTQALGYVLQLSGQRAIISLPGGCVGTVQLSEVSDVASSIAIAPGAMNMPSSSMNKKKRGHQQDSGLQISDLLKVNQVVRVHVLGQANNAKGKKNDIILSMRSSYINRHLQVKNVSEGFALSGCVASKEDHGYVISTGVATYSFFMPMKNVDKSLGELVQGQPVETIIESINQESKSVTLKAGPKECAVAVTRGSNVTNLALNQVAPGMLVSAKVDKICANGFTATFLGLFHGAIDELSMCTPLSQAAWQEKYTPETPVTARVVFIDVASKSIRLSLRPHVLGLKLPPSSALPPLGSIVSTLTVCIAFKKTGVLLSKGPSAEDMDDGESKKTNKQKSLKKQQQALEEGTLGVFVHKGFLGPHPNPSGGDDNDSDHEGNKGGAGGGGIIDPDKIEKMYKAGKSVAAVRVMGYHLVEGLVFGSNKEGVTAIPDAVSGKAPMVLHSSDVQVGERYTVTVQSVNDFGLVLRIGTNGTVQGICPSLHLTDASTASYDSKGKLKVPLPSSKVYKKGMKMIMRAWEVSGSSILLTHKASLMEIGKGAGSTEQLMLSYSEATVGRGVTGVVSRVSSSEGLVVHFAQKMKATIPIAVLMKQGVMDPAEAYRVGQVLTTVIVSTAGKADGRLKGTSKNLVAALNIGKKETILKMAAGLGYGGGQEEKEASAAATKMHSNNNDDDDDKMDQEKDDSDSDGDSDEAPLVQVSGQVTKVKGETLFVRLDDGRLGALPRMQCYDKASSSSSKWEKDTAEGGCFAVGATVESAVVLESTKDGKKTTISVKPALLKAQLDASEEQGGKKAAGATAALLPSSFEQLYPGQKLVGFVIKAEQYGAVVRFRGSVAGLCPARSLLIKSVAPVEGDTLVCYVNKIDMSKQPPKLLLTCQQQESGKKEAAGAVASPSPAKAPSAAATYIITSVDATSLSVESTDGSSKGIVHVSNAVSGDPKWDDLPALMTAIEQEQAQAKEKKKRRRSRGNSIDEIARDAALADPRHPFSTAKEGATVQACQIGYNNKTGMAMLALSGPLAAPAAAVTAADKKKRKTSAAGASTAGGSTASFTPLPLVQWKGAGKVEEGSAYSAVILRKEPLAVVLALSPYVQSRLYFADFSANVEHVRAFAAHAYPGMKVVVTATKVSTGSNGNALAVSRLPCEVNGAQAQVGKLDVPTALPDEKYTAGQKVFGTLDLLSRRSPAQPYVLISLRGGKIGRVDLPEINDEDQWEDLSCLREVKTATAVPYRGGQLKHGSVVEAVVLTCDTVLYLSMRPSRLDTANSDSDSDNDEEADAGEKEGDVPEPEVGETVSGFVANSGPKGVFVRLGRMRSALVEKRELSDEFVSDPEAAFPVGKLVQGVVLSTSASAEEEEDDGKKKKSGKKKDSSRSSIKLSLKHSRVRGMEDRREVFSELKTREGKAITGVVKKIDEEHGVFVAVHSGETASGASVEVIGLARRVSALPVAEANAPLSEKFSVGDVVRCLVLKVNEGSQKVSLGLKPGLFKKLGDQEEGDDDSDDEDEDDDSENDDEEEEGGDDSEDEEDDDDNDGIVMAVDSDDNMSDDEEVERLIREASMKDEDDEEDDDDNDGIVMAVDSDDNMSDDEEVERLIREASMKDEDDEEDDEDEDDEDDDDTYTDAKMEAFHQKKRASKRGDKAEKEEEEDSDSDSDSDDDNAAAGPNVFSRDAKSSSAAAASGMMWSDFQPSAAMDVENEDSDSDVEEEDSGDDDGKGKSRRSKQADKKKEKKEAERSLLQKERKLVKLADGEVLPESADDYERLILAKPHSSFLWIQYMSHHLELADIESARAVGKRALEKIHYRKEDEQFKVWVALINMEHAYGDATSLQETFKEAVMKSKGKYLHLKLADLYEEAGDKKGAQAVYDKALKGYKYSKKVWGAYLVFHLRQKQPKEAKDLLRRAMQSLSKHKHIETLRNYAMAEFDVGSADRGRVVMEELLASYPKKSDLAHVFVDKEIKCGNIREARALLERLITFNYNLKNKMTLFKKYLAFEKAHGGDKEIEAVKAKAQAYADSIA